MRKIRLFLAALALLACGGNAWATEAEEANYNAACTQFPSTNTGKYFKIYTTVDDTKYYLTTSNSTVSVTETENEAGIFLFTYKAKGTKFGTDGNRLTYNNTPVDVIWTIQDTENSNYYLTFQSQKLSATQSLSNTTLNSAQVLFYDNDEDSETNGYYAIRTSSHKDYGYYLQYSSSLSHSTDGPSYIWSIEETQAKEHESYNGTYTLAYGETKIAASKINSQVYPTFFIYGPENACYIQSLNNGRFVTSISSTDGYVTGYSSTPTAVNITGYTATAATVEGLPTYLEGTKTYTLISAQRWANNSDGTAYMGKQTSGNQLQCSAASGSAGTYNVILNGSSYYIYEKNNSNFIGAGSTDAWNAAADPALLTVENAVDYATDCSLIAFPLVIYESSNYLTNASGKVVATDKSNESYKIQSRIFYLIPTGDTNTNIDITGITVGNEEDFVTATNGTYTLKYTKNIPSSGYGTVCLPYATKADVDAYTIASKNEDNTYIQLSETSTKELTAGLPYVYKGTASGKATFTISSTTKATTAGTDGNLTGTWAGGTGIANGDYVLSGGKWYCVDNADSFTLGKFSAYISAAQFSGLSKASESRGLTMGVLGGETTGINAIGTDFAKGSIYNIKGQKALPTHKGLYIVNGKKMIVK